MLSLLWHQIQRTLDLVFDLYRWCGSLGLQLSLGWFAPECEAAGMRSSTFKSEAVVLSQKSTHSVSGMELLLQVEEFKYVAVLWGKRRVGDWQIGVDAEERGECQFKAVDLRCHPHLWSRAVVTEGMRSLIQVAEMNFLWMLSGLSLRDGEWSRYSSTSKGARRGGEGIWSGRLWDATKETSPFQKWQLWAAFIVFLFLLFYIYSDCFSHIKPTKVMFT